MAKETPGKPKIGLTALILMIFTSVFGFTNIPRAFYLMGYAAIPWYILAAITFFIPFALMMAEYGAAFKEKKGGIYSWMAESINPKFAFVGTFMWYTSYLVWMVNVGTGIWIVLSNAIFGTDMTQTWGFGPFDSVQTLGILGVLWILLLTFVSTKGLDKIKKISSVGGTAVALINVLLLIGGVLIIIGNGGKMLEPVTMQSFFKSPNADFTSIIAVFGFMVYAIFAYGGIEVIGGLVDETENAEVNFPKGVLISAVVIAIGYAVGIFLMGSFTNWADVFTGQKVTLGNVAYFMMNNMGKQLGLAFGASAETAAFMGRLVARYMGISMFLALTGAFFTLIFSPLKQIIEGTPKALWPGRLAERKNGLPIRAMWIQAGIVIFMLLLVSFGGKGAKEFFQILVNMTNVAMTIPYMFLAVAFIGFKRQERIKKPFLAYKSNSLATMAAWVVTFIVGFANVFTIIEPYMKGRDQAGLLESIYAIAGPVIFGVIAYVMFTNYEKKVKKDPSLAEPIK